MERTRSRRRQAMLRCLGFSSVLGALPMMLSCATIPGDPGPVQTVLFEAPQDDLNSLQYNPTFEPDYNNLTAQPWVQPATKGQQDDVDVYPDRLEFPETRTEVLAWELGRVVAGAPSQGTGKNPMGFARRVVSVALMSPKIVVMTTTMAIEDVLQGDVQIQITPDNSQPMDLSKADLDWVSNNLYYNSVDLVGLPGESLVDDAPADLTALHWWNTVAKAVSGAVKAVAQVATQVYLAVTPATVSGSTGFDKSISVSNQANLFGPLVYHTSITTKKGNGVNLSLSGNANYDASLQFQQGLQLGAKIALPGHNANSEFWLNIDSQLRTHLHLNLALEAAIEAAAGESGSALQETLNKATDATQDILNASRKTFLGQEDVKPAANWKKTLYLTKPSLTTFFAGPVPVVVTSTFQVDLECGLEAKASLSTDLLFDQNARFKFKMKYKKGAGTTFEGPIFDAKKTFQVQVTGGGEVSLSCGLIPRVNVLMYDTVGLFAGIRGSLVARAAYESECKPNPNDFHPTGKVTLGLYGNVGLQIGARLQTPGSSFAGSKGHSAGYDFGPLEPWNTEFKLLEKEWDFAKGLGYCTPTCKNGTKDGDETDTDCGGSCGRCQLGQGCQRNTDCSNSVCNAGVCSTNKCGDTVRDGAETDIDCGGPTATCATRCAVGKGCDTGADCSSAFCGANGTPSANLCVTNHCSDGVQDADEGGIDCSGKDCAKCANGMKANATTDCLSGYWNGTNCVPTSCEDGIQSGDETDRDCGGLTCQRRCGIGQVCKTSSDCSTAAPSCNPMTQVCTIPPEPASATPVPNTVEVDLSQAAVLTLYRDIDPTTVTVMNVTATAAMMSVPVTVSYASRVITISPMTSWPQGSVVTITAGVGIKDVNGGSPFALPYIWSFTTLTTANLLSQWRFDNNGNDSSGNNRTATLQGTAAYTLAAHQGAAALSLDGGPTAYADAGTFDVGSQFTISGWFFLPPTVKNSINTIIANGASGNTQNGFKVFINSFGTSDLRVIFETGNGTVGCLLQTTANFVTTGKWQHFAFVVDRTNSTATFYWNGLPAVASGCVRNDFATNQALSIGRFSDNAFHLQGSIDDLRIYNVLLSAQSIAKIAAQ